MLPEPQYSSAYWHLWRTCHSGRGGGALSVRGFEKFREVEGCGAMAGGLCENASRILQISALKDAGTTL